MKCLNCSHDNPSDAKFCQNCGKPLQRVCSNCGTANEPDAKFCKNCGTNLAAHTSQPTQPTQPPGRHVDRAHSRLEQYIPKELLAKLEAARANQKLGGERRIATILFCDVEGSTAMAESLDPEEWTEIMNRAFAYLIPPVYRYEGMVARLMGDAVLAFFGAPIAHEDDPQRAVLAGLDIIAGTRDYREKLRAERGLEFSVRVGINTGLVAAGEVGTDLRVEYTVMGDAVNIAARLQSAARPMTVLISETTYRFVAPAFECVDVGPVEVKGKAEPLHAYEVLGPQAAPSRMRGLAGLASPMVGRDTELAALLQASDAVRAGLGRSAVIIGEPGLGKSRLIAEWKARVEKSPPHGAGGLDGRTEEAAEMQWAEGRCLSYGQSLAYHLLIDLLRSLVGVPAAATEPELRAATLQLTQNLFGSAVLDVYPYLGHLLSLQLEGEALERVRLLDPQALQTHYLISIEQLLRALAERRPPVLVFEDIHWADPSSVDLLSKLLPLALEAPVLFCFVTRPDRDAPGWKLVVRAREVIGAGLTELSLNPLTEADSRQLVTNLLEVEALPEQTRAAILGKAEGNPFFVEEVIRMLIDHGAITRQGERWVASGEVETVEIPGTLHSLLLARIDRLPDEAKQALRVASVIGRQFPVRVLEQVLREE